MDVVDQVMEKINAFVEAEADRQATFAILGGDVGVTDEERARWNAAPTLEDIERDVRELARHA